MARRRRRAEEQANHERWLVSYADMVTLLMVFFIVLFASSQINVSKYRAIQNSAAEAFGAGPRNTDQAVGATNKGGDVDEGPLVVTEPGKDKVDNPNEHLVGKLQDAVEDAGLSSTVRVYEEGRGIVISFTDSVLFASGKADVLPQGREVLERLSPVLNDQDHPIVVEGHTDNLPIRTAEFPSNWELSTSRATQVLRTLLGGGVPADQLAAAGYADTHPLKKNNTAKGRAANRRVEVIIVNAADQSGSEAAIASESVSRRAERR